MGGVVGQTDRHRGINPSSLITVTEIASYHWPWAIHRLSQRNRTPLPTKGSWLPWKLCVCVFVYKYSAQVYLTSESATEEMKTSYTK